MIAEVLFNLSHSVTCLLLSMGILELWFSQRGGLEEIIGIGSLLVTEKSSGVLESFQCLSLWTQNPCLF